MFKRATELFQEGLTVREVAATLHISKSEAGRIRLRATDEGLLATGDGADRPSTNGHDPISLEAQPSHLLIADTSEAQPQREIFRTGTSSLYATFLKTSTTASALLNIPQPLRAARNQLSTRDCGEGCCPCPVAYGCRVGTSRNAAYFDWEQSGLIRRT
jgi:hypothetical protein